MLTALSVQGVRVRLTGSALEHIAAEHPELDGKARLILDVLSRPDLVVAGQTGELSAVRLLRSGRRLAVVYRLLESDGFVITAFYLKGPGYHLRRKQVWP